MANSQHRCVFVGNIPYDATEEQLVQICEEVGPVVSFRLVIDRETGKPKGYGFCEYKDEETALSARRNLQGYEINGRQLRVDFAENDKNTDRSREQGRGGPGMAANTDSQKQLGGPPVHGDAGLHQPVGLPVAMAAAAVMAGALGGVQSATNFSENGLQSQPVLGSDPLTLQLAKMSRNQLNEILSEIKVMATQNKEQARQLLLSTPHLPKAIFQAQIMLGMVSPQMLQMPNIRQASGPLTPPLLPVGQPGQLPAVQNFPGLPPLAQHKVNFGLNQQPQHAQMQAGHPNSMVHNQYSAPSQFSGQPRFQNPVLQQGLLPGPSGLSARPPMHSQQMGNVTVGPPSQAVGSSSMKQQVQVPMVQHPSQVGSSNATVQPSLLNRPSLMDHGFQPNTSMMSGPQNNVNKNSDRLPQVTNNDPAWARRVDSGQSLPSGLSKKENMTRENPDPNNRPSKMVKLDDGSSIPFLEANARASTSIAVSSQAFGMSGNQIPKAESASNSEKQVSQLPQDVESALLQQVLNLTPEQLSSLPPDQQQQVIQLQQMLRQPI